METTQNLAPDLDILYLDDHLLVVNKASGVLVHRGWGKAEVTLVDLVRDYTENRKAHPIHRIDRATSGVVLFARNAQVAAILANLFAERLVTKRYLTLVRGECPERGLVDYALPDDKGTKHPAVTAFCRRAVLQTTPRHCSLVEAVPKSGRLHQIRRHLRHLNHPVIGDSNYGDCKVNRGFKANYPLPRLALHALSLTLPHPVTEKSLTLVAPLAPDFAQTLMLMGCELETLTQLTANSAVNWVDQLGANELYT